MAGPESYHTQSPDERVDAQQGGNVNRTGINISIDSSIVALILAVTAIVIVASQAFYQPQLVEAKIQAGIAKAEQEAHAATTTALVTQRDQTQLREALQRKGFAVPPKD